MLDGELPAEIAAVADTLLISPDKNTLEWKAFDSAVTQSGLSPEKLLLKLNAWSSPLALHRHRFLSQYFPRGIDFPLSPWKSMAAICPWPMSQPIQ